MRRVVVASLLAAAFAPAAPAVADCTGTKQVALCSDAGCTDLCHWDVWVRCDVPKADVVCDLVDPY